MSVWLEKLAGEPGSNAYTTTIASFTQPAVGANVNVSVEDTSWMAIGMSLFLEVGGYYKVAAVVSATVASLTNLGTAGNASVSATVGSSKRVAPAGVPGAAGSVLAATTTASFTQPAVSGTVNVSVSSSTLLTVNAYVLIAGGGYYQVTAVPDGTHATVRNLGYSGNAAPSATVATAAPVTLTGPQGATGVPGSTGPTGPTGADGAGIVTADFILTSNDTLSGLAVRDGVTPTAGMVALAVGQTTASQNGRYTVTASGAWTNIFTSDASVSAAIGVPVFVKPGGLSVPPEGVYYGLTSGATLAGAKVYAKTATGGSRAPVRAIQTQPLFTGGTIYGTPWVYNNAAGTITAPVNGSVGTPWAIFDNVVNPATGLKDYEVNTGSNAYYENAYGAQGGVYTLVDGTGGTPAVLTRRKDLNTPAGFLGGVAYEVLDGTKHKGSRRQITNQTAIVLGTTKIAISDVTPSDTLVIDLSKAPYNIRDWHNTADWSNNDAKDYGIVLSQALYDYRNSAGITLQLPTANGGCVVCCTPVRGYGRNLLRGSYSKLASNFSGGHLFHVQQMGASPTLDGFPQKAAAQVDTGTGAYYPQIFGGAGLVSTTPTALSLWRSAQDPLPSVGLPAADRQFFWNVSDMGLLIDSWPKFQMDVTLSWERIDAALVVTHVVSCRGRRTVTDGDINTPCFFVFLDESTAKLTARLRVTDTTKGVYSATTQTGGGTATCTGDATIKPIEDAPNFTVRVKTGGTIGTAGCVVEYTINGYSWHAPIALGTANNLVISNDLTDWCMPFSCKVNFGAGTLVAGTTYAIACSGVNQQLQLTSNQVVTADLTKNWIVTLMYDGATFRFGVSRVGQPLDTSPSMATGVAATGVIKQRFWEHTVLGAGQNFGAGESGQDFYATRANFGSLRFLNGFTASDGAHQAASSPVMPPSTTPAALVSYWTGTTALTGQKLFFRPSVAGELLGPDGLRQNYLFETEIAQLGWALPRTALTGIAYDGGGFESIEFATGSAASQRGSGLLTITWRNRRFHDLRFIGGLYGWCNVGQDFGSSDTDIFFSAKQGFSFRYHQGQINATGRWCMQDSNAPCYGIISAATFTCPGTLFLNTEINFTVSGLIFDQMQASRIGNLSIDAENQINTQSGLEVLRINMINGQQFQLGGNTFLAETYRSVVCTGDASNGTGGNVTLRNFTCIQSHGGIQRQYPPLSSTLATAPPFIDGGGNGFTTDGNVPLTAVSITDRPGKFLRGGTADVKLLTSGTQSVTWQRGVALKLGPATLGASSVYTIGVVGAQVGDTQDIFIEAQPSTWTTTITNGGAAGATGIYVNTATPAATKDRYRLRLDESFNWVSV